MRLRVGVALVAAVLAGTLIVPGATAKHVKPPSGGSGSVACGSGSVQYSPTTLWPPNHKLQPVTITSALAAFVVTGVTHEEEGHEKGSTAKNEPDYQITDATGGGGASNPATVQLRAERLSKPKDGRTYTITVACGDPAAGGGTASLTVVVPHSSGKHK